MMAEIIRFCANETKSGYILDDGTQVACTAVLLVINVIATWFFIRNILQTTVEPVDKHVKILCFTILFFFNLELVLSLLGKIICLVDDEYSTFLPLAAVITLVIHSIACVC